MAIGRHDETDSVEDTESKRFWFLPLVWMNIPIGVEANSYHHIGIYQGTGPPDSNSGPLEISILSPEHVALIGTAEISIIFAFPAIARHYLTSHKSAHKEY